MLERVQYIRLHSVFNTISNFDNILQSRNGLQYMYIRLITFYNQEIGSNISDISSIDFLDARQSDNIHVYLLNKCIFSVFSEGI